MIARKVDIDSYRYSSSYSPDLAATCRVWGDPYILATSGAFVFLTYLASPTLIAARSGAGKPARSVLDGDRERAFLLRFLGLTESNSWQGGVANPRVLRQAQLLGKRHSQFIGMKQEYMNFMSAVIALAPLRVKGARRTPPTTRDRERYWRYISCASSAIGTSIGSESDAENSCRDFISGNSDTSAEGAELLRSLVQHHPDHVARAIPLLFDGSRVVIDQLLPGAS